MSKVFYKIEDFIDTTSSAFALKGTSPLSADATEVTMCSSSDVLAEIEDNFGERSIYVKETTTPMTSFAAMWTRWLGRRGDMLAASWQALHSEYNPLDNYDRKEDGSDTKTITPAAVTHTITPAETTETITPAETTLTSSPAETTETVTPAEVTTTSSPAEVTNTKTPTVTRSHSESLYTFNSSSAVPISSGDSVDVSGNETDAVTVQTAGSDAVTVQTAGSNAVTVQTAGSDAVTVQTAGSNAVTVQTAGSNIQTVQTAGSDVLSVQESGEEVTEYGRHVYGNAGTTMTQTMLEAELSLREKDFIYSAICEFINLYSVYA